MKAQSGTGALSLIVYRGDCMKKFKDNVQAYLFLIIPGLWPTPAAV